MSEPSTVSPSASERPGSPIHPALGPACLDKLADGSRHVVSFPQGLPGFEQCQHFVVVESPDLHPLRCLQAVTGPRATFVAIDPGLVVPGYRVPISETERARLKASQDDPLVSLALVTVAEDGTATVNLRAPVVINPSQMIGCQILPDDSTYSLRHPLGRS